MIIQYEDRLTKKSNLSTNESISTYENWSAQQNPNAFEVFHNFLAETKPKRILEIGTSLGGFTSFLNFTVKKLGLSCDILSLDVIEHSWYKDIRESGVDLRVENVFNDDYTEIKKEIVDFIKGEGVTIVLCDGGNKIKEFNLLSKFVKDGDFILAHDYSDNNVVFQEKIYGKIWNWYEISDADIELSCKVNNLVPYKKDIFDNVAWVCKVKNGVKKITLVTGIWDIGRNELTDGWSRPYKHYLDKFESILTIDANLIVFGDSSLREFVFERRSENNTQFIERPLEWFKQNDFFDKIQRIRKDEKWYNQVEWLKESTQAKLEMYNPLVMSKMFLLHDAKIMDKFNSELMFWIDGGLTNTVHIGYFTHDKVLDKLTKYISKFSFVCFPYEATTEIHGFEAEKLYSIAGKKVNRVARGGFFGGPKESISKINAAYYSLLSSTLESGYMGTEESIFSIICEKYAEDVNYFEIEDNGLVGKFFEDLKNDKLVVKSNLKVNESTKYDLEKVGLYVMTFNSPKQFSTLIQSMLLYDENFINKPQKFLLDNSTDPNTFREYSDLCEKYNFEHIKKDNLGICGGRQFIAEHFENSDNHFMFFFEDDMFFYNGESNVCRNGFNRYIKNLYLSSLNICKNENFDFLKLNYSEFFGDNGTQWAWYNVPQDIREKYWPNKNRLPEIGLDPDAPKTIYKNILSYQGIPFTNGDVYYCNWPQVVSKHGNKKMFLDTKWAHPFEQTWMSYMFQLTKKGELNPGLLLITPTEHNRFEHYGPGLRKES